MPYLIDGHNLIPHLGISLQAVDDEMELVAVLREYCRLCRKKAELYFDDAPAGQPVRRTFGALAAYFIRPPREADDAIAARLTQLGNQAKNWTVVSSDHRVQAAARESHAECLSSEAFARQVRQTIGAASQVPGDPAEPMTDEELREWLDIFKKE